MKTQGRPSSGNGNGRKMTGFDALVKKYDWWWRSEPGVETTGPLNWPSELLRAGWSYELARRLKGNRSWPPFTKLDADFKKYFEDHFRREEAVRIYADEKDGFVFDHTGWFRLAEYEWNLRASNEELRTAFFELINQRRAEEKIRIPKKLEGYRNKPPSWRWPELLDRKDRSGEVLESKDLILYDRAVKAARFYFASLYKPAFQPETPPETHTSSCGAWVRSGQQGS